MLGDRTSSPGFNAELAGLHCMASEKTKPGGRPFGSPGSLLRTKSQTASAGDKDHPERDPTREALDTIVFVVILVLLLKTFIAEAFVIPTGSMADTLYGHHHVVVCPQCHRPFPVNASKEIEADPHKRERIVGAECPNCRLPIRLKSTSERGPGL